LIRDESKNTLDEYVHTLIRRVMQPTLVEFVRTLIRRLQASDSWAYRE